MKDSEFVEGKTRCPKCGSENFGHAKDLPIRTEGWYGDARFEWRKNPHRVVLVAVRCGECEYFQGLLEDK